jgi:flagellum-specific peptidoglycan hydrolase FlgJ
MNLKKKDIKKYILSLLTALFVMCNGSIVANAETYNENNKYKEIQVVAAKLINSTSFQDKFIGTVLQGAVKNYDECKIYPSVTIAQAILESGWGKSDKAVKYNNLFGIKADKNWKGKKVQLISKEWSGGKMKNVTSNWRVYNSLEESIIDHGKFLYTRPWYANAGIFKARNYVEQISAIKKGGYCTDPSYVTKVCTIINKYSLWKYDPNGKEIKL